MIAEKLKKKGNRMAGIVVIVGTLAVSYCLATLIVPNSLRRFIDFLCIGSRLYLAGLLRLVLGVLLLILSSQARFWGYVVTLGLFSAASGASVFFFALRRTKKLLRRLQHQSNLTLRLFAIIALAIWAVLVYSLLPAVPLFSPR